jgi:hypothetical protein
MRDAIRQEHPGVIVGFDGAEQYSSYDGYDWWLMAREMDMINVYHNYLIPDMLMSAYGTTGAVIQAPFVPENKHGHLLAATQVTRFRDGDTWYYGVLSDFFVYDQSPVTAALPFPAGKHVYDVRGQRYLGAGGVIHDTLEPGRPAMYAALPYNVAGLSVDCPPRANRGEPIEVAIQVVGDAGRLGPHVVRVQVVHPDGVVPEYWPRTIYLPAGHGPFTFTPALNASTGTWRVRATDAVSGMAGADRVRIR